MTYRTLLRGSLVLVAVAGLAACGSDDKSSSTTAAAATTAASTAAPTTRPATTTAAPTTKAAAATTTAPAGQPGYEIPNSLPAASTASGASLSLHDDPKLGKILVDSAGFTMYLFTKDTGTTSVCTDKCATTWPAALVTGTPTAGAGLDAGKLTASAQPDGSMQLTYNGHLLYRFAGDSAAGQTNGQDVGDVWYVLDAAGNQVG